MRGTKTSVTLAILVAISAVGCKSMPSLTWWKTASKTKAADSTAIAHSAPELPSEVALQTENPGGSSSPAATATPYVSTGAPAVNPSAYPSTSAPPFNPLGNSAQVAAAPAPSTPTVSSPSPGSVAMPYNPNSVPPATQSVAAAVEPEFNTDRYASIPGMESAPTTTTAASTAPAYPATANVAAATTSPTPNTSPMNSATPGTSLGNRYGNVAASSAAPQYSATTSNPAASPVDDFNVGTIPAAPNAALAASQPAGTANVGGRYAQSSTPGYPVAGNASLPSTSLPMNPAPPQVTQTAAASEPYRPGGTSSYPSSMQSTPQYEVASRLEATGSSTPEGSSVPNVATPESTSAPTQRYW